MYPAKTTYRVIIQPNQAEEKRLKALWRKYRSVCGKWERLFPLIVAERDGQIVALLGAKAAPEAVILGPLVVDLPGNRLPVAMRMIDLCNMTLKAAGVSRYIFHVNRTAKAYYRSVLQLGLTPYDEDRKGYWFAAQI